MQIVEAKIGFVLNVIPRNDSFDSLIIVDDQTKEETTFSFGDLLIVDMVNYISIEENTFTVLENHVYDFKLILNSAITFRGTFKGLSTENYNKYIENKETSYSVGNIVSNSTENKYKIYE